MIRSTAKTFSAVAVLLFSSSASAAVYFVGPDGAGQDCTREAPCNIGTGADFAQAGDTVILLDGVYTQGLFVANVGTPDAWITFRADECALPIIEGKGEDAVADADGNYPSGVFSSQGQYIRYQGIVSRYWDSGFSNGWTGEKTTNSNGHIEYINCIGDGNHRTAFAMYSAPNFVVRECIAAHSGGSPTHSWSSGIQMYAVQGTPDDNIVERSVSFENIDAQKKNDGSGFIVDEATQGASFINNIGFHNGGSCMRLTRSINTRMIHFSCYHNGQNPEPNSPADPGEFYFTEDVSRASSTVLGVLAAASGSAADPAVFMHPPTTGLMNNVTIDSGAATFFSDPEGMNPDFRPPASAAAQIENQGPATGAPDLDIGFDPKCLVKQVPNVPYQQSWWSYSVDYDYIRSIGGVAQCFHPKQRTGGADVGAYEMSGEPHAFSTPGTCVRGPDPDLGRVIGEPGTGGTGSTAGTGGQGTATGSQPNSGGAASGGATSGTGATAAGAQGSGAQGTGAQGTGGQGAGAQGAGAQASGGALNGTGSMPGMGTGASGSGNPGSGSGSSCQLAVSALTSRPDTAAWLLAGLTLLGARRRRKSSDLTARAR